MTTYAPADLLVVQRYLRDMTGQPWASLGIVGDPAHGRSGYHIGGLSVLAGDYSVAESSRDRSASEAASAFDLGGDFARFREITLGIVHACQRADTRTKDIREVIYTPDGSTVRRWDRLGIRTSGDSSHLTHTHISFHRDSEGRRDDTDNFLGLLVELFEGADVLDNDEREALFAVRNAVRWIDGRVASLADGTADYSDPGGKAHPNALVRAVARIDSRPAGALVLTPEDRAAIVADVLAGLPTVQQIAKAVNDDQAQRLVS